MNKKQILDRLKKNVGSDSVRLPSQIDFSLSNSILEMHVNGSGVRDNMQTNGSAFEGWALCIKACIPEVSKVILKWDSPKYSSDHKEKTRQEKHYNRFLMRVVLFSRYFDWFAIHDDNKDLTNSFFKIHSHLFINYPKTESKEKVSENGKINKREAILERQLVEKLRESISFTNHQLPVGLFDDEVKIENTCTPRGASQIDLWQIDKDTLRIFELKDECNNEVGIISELMFYANVMNELINGRIQYPQSIISAKDIRNIKSLYKAIQDKSISCVEAVFLVYNFHPLVATNLKSILKIINESMKGNGISFKEMIVTDII